MNITENKQRIECRKVISESIKKKTFQINDLFRVYRRFEASFIFNDNRKKP